MIIKTDPYKCTGCSACASICPKKCIEMREDSEGFDRPYINEKKCISCGICSTVCPVNKKIGNTYKTECYVAQNNSEDIRRISSAGGFIGALAEFIFKNNGVLYGAGYDKKNVVCHMRVTSMDECLTNKIFASKYVVSDIQNSFVKLKSDLKDGKLVCFVGLPCQVSGLKSFLQKEYDNLVTVDLTCYGVPSRKLYKKYINYLENVFHSKIVDVRFRDKSYGYSVPTMVVEFEKGFVKSQNSHVKSYLRAFFSNISISKSCEKCVFKGIDRVSDFTIGDCKNIRSFIQEYDDDKGTTVVYVHSKKGKEIIHLLNCRIAKVPVNEVISSCGQKMIERVKLNEKRDAFFEEIDKLNYEQLINKYCPATLDEKIASFVKGFLKIIGLNQTSILRKLKKR